jgi:hypothetical protein
MRKSPRIGEERPFMIEEELRGFSNSVTIEHIDEATDVVTTRFIDKNGYPIRIFVRQRGSQYYLFNEKARIFRHEKIGRWGHNEAKDRFKEILRRFDVYHINGEISTEATKDNLPARLRNLLQALIVLDATF